MTEMEWREEEEGDRRKLEKCMKEIKRRKKEIEEKDKGIERKKGVKEEKYGEKNKGMDRDGGEKIFTCPNYRY